MKKLLVLLFAAAQIITAQVEHSAGEMPVKFYPGFDIDLANYPMGNPEKTRVDVFLKMPYSNIQFIKTAKGFQARYGVTLTFYDEDGENIIVEKMWNEKVAVEDFEQAISARNYNYSYKSIDLLMKP